MQDQRRMFEVKLAQSLHSASNLRLSFDSQMAQSVRSASDQQTRFDNRMAKAVSDASDMKEAYAQMTCNFEDQKKAVVKATQVMVGNSYLGETLCDYAPSSTSN